MLKNLVWDIEVYKLKVIFIVWLYDEGDLMKKKLFDLNLLINPFTKIFKKIILIKQKWFFINLLGLYNKAKTYLITVKHKMFHAFLKFLV